MKIPDDEFIQELLPEFVDDWLVNMNKDFDTFLEAKDEKEMYRLAHTLKGSCFQFSLDDLGNEGIKLMELIKENKWEEIATYKEKIITMFKEVNTFLKEHNLR